MERLNWPPLPPSPCPANNFGLGIKDLTPEEREFVVNKFDQWDSDYPDDPEGKEYMARYEERLKESGIKEVLKAPKPEIKSEIEIEAKATPMVKKRLRGRRKSDLQGRTSTTCQVRLTIREGQRDAIMEKLASEGLTFSSWLRAMIDEKLNSHEN